MEFTVTNLTRNDLYPTQPNLTQSRTYEIFASVDAHTQLRELNFSTRYDSSIDSYVITFYGVWSRINLTPSFFADLRDNSILLTNDERDLKFNTAAREKLQPIVNLVRSLLDDVTPAVGMNFSAITFWEVVNYLACPKFIRPIEAVAAAFRLIPGDSEISVLTQFAGVLGRLDTIGGETAMILRSQTPIYYDNRSRLLSTRNFRVIKELENKEVAWFLNKAINPWDIVYGLTSLTNYDNRYMVYHSDQTMNWPHLFIYPDAESYTIGAAYNVYRNWKMLYDTQRDLKAVSKRMTFTYGGWYFNGNSIIFGIMSTSPYPLDFSPNTFNNYQAIDRAVEKILLAMPSRSHIISWSRLSRALFKPLISDFSLGLADPSDYQVVKWLGISTIAKGVHSGDDDAVDITVCALPDPSKPTPDFCVIDSSQTLKLDHEFSWVASMSSFFSSFGFSILTNGPMRDLPEFGSFDEYRKSWCNFRAESKDAKMFGYPVNQDTLEKAFEPGSIDAYMNIRPASPVPDILDLVHKQDEKARVRWNASTSKLLALIDGMIYYGILPSHVDGDPPLEVQFFGVIAEPMISLLKLLPSWYTVLPGIGAQAIHVNLRTDITSFLYNSSPYLIISDIDQSEEEDEDDVANLIINHVQTCLSFARGIVAYKIQYTTPRILNLICRSLQYKTFSHAYILKPCAAGVFSLETFLVLRAGDDGLLDPMLAATWLEERMMLLAPKPASIGLYDAVPLNTTVAVMNALNRDRHFYYCIRASNQADYSSALSAAMSVSENFKVLPIGSKFQFEVLVTGSRWRKRSKLTERVGAISSGSIPQGGDLFPLSGPSRSTRTPINTYQGSFIQEAGMYNLAVKRAVKSTVESLPGFNASAPHSLMDIGGRSCEGVVYTRTHWRYAVMDSHSLPPYINRYNITHLNYNTNWNDPEPFDGYDIIVALFVIPVDGALQAVQADRINFLKTLANRGKIVLFNYYSNQRATQIKRAGHRSIRYNANLDRGTFGNYDVLPWLLDENDPVFQDTRRIHIGFASMLSAQSFFGTAINTEVVNWNRDFNDFCPLRIIVK